MQKVISINLNGNAYQLEEEGYHALRAYLDRAADQLAGNPDTAEIVADLEQAIAEKCTRYLGPHKTVVANAEVERVLQEMGPVDPGPQGDTEPVSAPAGEQQRKKETGASKRLYQIREGAMLTGVCNGLAAYFGVDVTLVRIIFVVLAVITKGLWLLVYVVMSFVIPLAETSEDRAAARGQPFSAQDVINRAKENVAKFKNEKWRRHRREWRRAMRGQRWRGTVPVSQAEYTAQVWAGVLMPIFGLLQAATFVLLAILIATLVRRGTVFGWTVPDAVPLWAAVVTLVVLYQIVVSPINAARYATYYTTHRPQEPWFVFANGVLSMAAAVFGFWLAYQYFPEFWEGVHNLPAVWDHIVRRF